MTNLSWKSIATFLSFFLLFYPQKLFSAEIKMLWSIEDTFQLPESATFDPVKNQIYISNMVKYAKDGSGFISRINVDGNNLKLKWLSGFNSPTGLSIHKNLLYAVDMDDLVIIEINTGKIINRIPAPDSENVPMLNDVAISEQGDVYVSGRASRKLYKLVNNTLVVFVDDSDRLFKANGLLVDNEHLIHGGKFWSRFSRKTSDLQQDNTHPKPSSSLYDFDGITHDGMGGYIVTVLDDPRLWHITNDGKTQPLSEQKINGIDIHFDNKSRRLFVPRVGGGLTVFLVD